MPEVSSVQTSQPHNWFQALDNERPDGVIDDAELGLKAGTLKSPLTYADAVEITKQGNISTERVDAALQKIQRASDNLEKSGLGDSVAETAGMGALSVGVGTALTVAGVAALGGPVTWGLVGAIAGIYAAIVLGIYAVGFIAHKISGANRLADARAEYKAAQQELHAAIAEQVKKMPNMLQQSPSPLQQGLQAPASQAQEEKQADQKERVMV